MWHFRLRRAAPSSAHARPNMFVLFGVTLLISVLLASCGGPTTAQSAQSKPTATATATPSPTPTPQPTLAPTPTDTPTPVPPAPTQAPPPPPPPPPPQQGPATLDLTPNSMSFVGHLDCPVSNGAYVCHARVFSRASNTHPLHWTSFNNIANNITFSPGSGTLAPGTSVDVFIRIPTGDCNRGLFFFRGQSNTHTITWAC